MSCRRFTLLLVVLVFTLAAVAAASQTPKIKEADLEKTPIVAGALRITLLEYRGSFLKIGNASAWIEVENTADEFVEFSPQLLSLVGKDNRQGDTVGVGGFRREELSWLPVTRKIAPGARIKEQYVFTAKIKHPARLYYDAKLIAEIL